MDYVNSARQKMKERKLLVTAMLRFANPMIAEIMIRCGIDSVCIDNEHYPFTDNDVVNIVRAVHGAGGKCTMRHVPKSHGALYRLMDMQKTIILKVHFISTVLLGRLDCLFMVENMKIALVTI